ncbi:ATP-binding protein [Paenibacillus sp. NPDC058177]|uniref:hybrid sensor histidine kinase/response regulator n=1 Tax=Paenibacillus sp. NPDC058177 TaxID=3346369 RepID=UPI0036DE26D8
MRNNTVLKNIATILLFITVLFGFRIAWLSIFTTSDSPPVVNGVLDLRGQDLEKADLFKLNGEWKFYPSKFIYHKDIAVLQNQSHTLKVPGDWSEALANSQGSSYGYGTYQLRILVDPLRQPVSLWIKQIQTSSAVEINGVNSAGAGDLSISDKAYKPRTNSYTAPYFAEGTTEIEVLIRAANFDHPYKGGIEGPVFFGSQDKVDSLRFISIGFQALTVIILLLHVLYVFILYLFSPEERVLLLVGLMTLSVAVIILFRNDSVLYLLTPFNYTWALKIRLIASMWQLFFIMLVFRKFIAAPTNNKLVYVFTAAISLYTAFLLVSPAPWVSESTHLGVHNFFLFSPFIWLIYIMGIMLFRKQKDKDVVFMLLSAAGIISNLLWNVWGSVLVYYPIDIVAAIVGFSAYWFKKYFQNAKENAQLNEQLKKADKLKDQFLANTSHELRTPLHGIMNIAQNVVTKENEKLYESSRKDMELLITISRRMSHMLGDLLDIARLQEHRITLHQEPLQIQSVVPGVIGMLKFMIEGKPVQLTMNLPDTTPPVLADEKRLVQVLYNLLHNALKYTEEGMISISTEVQNGRALIHISDTGVGMNKETQARIFLPYEQGAHGISDGRGIGLGLSICKQLVELHGGTLSVRSKISKGSVFSFDLPLADSFNQQAVTPAAALYPITDAAKKQLAEWIFPENEWSGLEVPMQIPPLLTKKKVNILAVDDDPVNLNVLMGILSTEPYTITTANSAREVLELLDKEQWDLLIADVMMPHMSGYELTQKVREHYSLSELPVLLLTARSQPADIYTGFLSGANDYVTKPVDAVELRYRIRALTELKQSINERLRIEAAYLQAQIHPHFLFNTLNSIMALGDLDTEKMQHLVGAFTSFLRISFDFLNTGELVELSHELDLVKAYLHIEQERFSDRLTIEWEVEPDISGLQVPPLSIQPLVENAVKHGLLSRNVGGTLHIRIAHLDRSTLVAVSDNGKGMEQDKADALLSPTLKGKGGIGLSNTNRRLTQLYGQGLYIHSRPEEGTTVSFVIPDRGDKLKD